MATLVDKLATVDELLRICESYAPKGRRTTVRPFPEDAEQLKTKIIDLLLSVGPNLADIREEIKTMSFVKMGRFTPVEDDLAKLEIPEEEQEYSALQEEARCEDEYDQDWATEPASKPFIGPLERVADENSIRRAAKLLLIVQERLLLMPAGQVPAHRGTPSTPPATPLSTARRRRGPPPDLDNHRRVSNVVSRYGDGWRNSDATLGGICQDLDKEGIAVPQHWTSWLKGRRTWTRALNQRRRLVVQAIEYRVKAVATSNRYQLPRKHMT